MSNGLGRRILVVTTTAALVATSALATAYPAAAIPGGVAADEDSVAPAALNDNASQHLPDLDAPKVQAPAFTINASQHVHGRAGGQAFVNVDLARRHSPGVNTSALSVHLSGPAGFKVIEAGDYTPLHGTPNADNWTCVAANSGTEQHCTYDTVLNAGEIPDGLRAKVAIADTVTASTGKIKAVAQWTEVRLLPGHVGENGDNPDTSNPTRQQTLTDSVDLSVDPKLTVSLTGVTGDVVHIPASSGSAADRTGHLVAKVGNIYGRDAAVEWEQLSGPTVQFIKPVSVSQPADTVGQEYVVPDSTADGETLKFRATVTSNGHMVTADRTVTVRTHEPATLAPSDARPELLAALAAATVQTPTNAKHGLPISKNAYKGAVAGKGVKHVRVTQKKAKKLKKVTLKFGHAAGVKSVKWKKLKGRDGILSKAIKKKDNITIRVPKKPGTWLIRGSAVLKNGKKISRTKILKIDPVRPKRKVKKRDAELRAATADAKSTQSFCSLGSGDVLQFADGSSLTLPSNYKAPAKCSSTSSQAFTGATLKYDGTTLGAANGTLAGSKVRLTSATFALPAKIASALPSGVPTSLTITPPAATPVTANQSNGAWGAWTGTFSVPWLSFIPVPSGWSTPKGNLVLEPTTSGGKVTGANLSLSQESAASDGSGGSVSMDMTFSTSGPSDVKVTASNLAVFQTGNGDQIEFSGQGTFYLSKGKTNSIVFSINCSAPDSAGNCPLASGFSLSKSTQLTWTQGSGLTLSGASATVGSGSNSYTFNLTGTYVTTGNWSFDVNNTGTPWTIGSTGVTLSGFNGSVAEKPSGSDSELNVTIGATVNNLSIGSELTVDSMTATISNQCASGTTGCTPGNVTVAIAVDATANFFGDEVDFNATANLNLSTMAFQFDTSETVDVDFGPEALNITSATLTLTNESLTGSCQPAGGTNPPASGVLSLGVSATGTAYGQPINIGGDVNSDGYCLWTALGDLSSGVFNGNDIVLAYSSYTGGASLVLPGNVGDNTATAPSTSTINVNVPAGQILLNGGFNMPQDVINALGLPPGTSTFTAQADIDLSSFTATVDYQLADPVFIGGGNETTTVATTIDDVQLKIGLTSSPMQASLSLVVDGNVVVASENGQCGPDSAGASPDCSYTPVGGSIGVSLGESGFSVNIQLGIDTSGGPVQDAFGQEGLQIDNLAISASAGVPGGISLAVNADAVLPSAWTGDVALVNNPTVDLAFNISETSPCMVFSIGEENSGTTYLDIDNGGIVTASYVNLVIAPDGCTVPVGASSSQTIPAGFGFAFEGAVLGDATTVMLDVEFTSTSTNITAALNLQGFDLMGVLAMNSTSLNLAMNSGADTFSLNFSGGFSLGDPSIAGGTVNVNGDIIRSGAGNFTLVLGGSGSVNLGGVIQASIQSNSNSCPSWTSSLSPAPNNCLVALQQSNGKVVNADVSANINFSVLGADLAGDIDLIYSDGALQDFHLGLGASVDVWVGSVQGTAYIDYCKGTLNTSGGTTNGNSCAIGGSTGTFRVFFDGSYSVGPCGDHWYDDLCYTDSFSDTVIDTSFSASSAAVQGHRARVRSTESPGLSVDFGIAAPAGKTAFAHPANASDYSLNLLWNQASVVGWTGTANGAGGYDFTRNVVVSAVAPTAVNGVPACTSPASGISWTPTLANPNPAPATVAPTQSACALEIVYATPGSQVLSDSDFGGNGTVIPESGIEAWTKWATTNSQTEAGGLKNAGANWFNTPQRGFAICTPAGDGQSTCALQQEDNTPLGTLISAAATGNNTGKAGSEQAHTQLVSGLLSPIGSLPAGVKLKAGSSVWSADGQHKLGITTDGKLQLWKGASNSYPNASGGSVLWQYGVVDAGAYFELAANGLLHQRASDGTSHGNIGSSGAGSNPFLAVGGANGLSAGDNTHLTTELWNYSG